MIISGGSRRNARFFGEHLMRADENELVRVAEIRGLASEDVRGALHEMDVLASGTQCQNFFYHANLNPRTEERLTESQWAQAVDTLERELHLDGHSRVIVEHEKDGRAHRHVLWSRIDVETMTAVSDSNNYAAHERAARELERAFGHEAVRGVHAERDGNPRPERRPKNWEVFRGHESGRDPQKIKAEITALWNASDNGPAFAQALADAGYILAKGDRRDFCIVDGAGDEHSLARRIAGAKAADITARMEDVERDALPTVAEARALARAERIREVVVEPPPLMVALASVAEEIKTQTRELWHTQSAHERVAMQAREEQRAADAARVAPIAEAKASREDAEEAYRARVESPNAGWFGLRRTAEQREQDRTALAGLEAARMHEQEVTAYAMRPDVVERRRLEDEERGVVIALHVGQARAVESEERSLSWARRTLEPLLKDLRAVGVLEIAAPSSEGLLERLREIEQAGRAELTRPERVEALERHREAQRLERSQDRGISMGM